MLHASCLFLITFFWQMSGLGNVLMFPASTPSSSGFAFPESQALHLMLVRTCESTPQLDASLSRLGSGIECWQSKESEFCDYDTSPKTKKSWRSITNHFNPSRSNSFKKSSHCQTKQDWTLRPKLAPILMRAFNTCQRHPTSAGRVVQECATCRDVHMHILSYSNQLSTFLVTVPKTAAKLLLFRGQCWQRIDVHQLEQMEYPSLMHQACDVETEWNSLTRKLLMTWTEGTENEHARAHRTFRQGHFRPAFGLAKKRETARTSNLTTSST